MSPAEARTLFLDQLGPNDTLARYGEKAAVAAILAATAHHDPRSLTDAVFDIASGADKLETGEAIYRAERDLMNAFFDRHRDAGLIAAGLIPDPFARAEVQA
jgi:hypothetical protein